MHKGIPISAAFPFLKFRPVRDPDKMNLRDPVLLVADEIAHIVRILRQQARLRDIRRAARTVPEIQLCPFSLVILQLLQQSVCPVRMRFLSFFVQFAPSRAAQSKEVWFCCKNVIYYSG